MLFDNRHDHARLAWAHVECPPGTLHVITGTLLNTRLQMLAACRANLGFAWLAGVLLAFALGGEVVRRGLLPLRRLSLQAAAIHPPAAGPAPGRAPAAAGVAGADQRAEPDAGAARGRVFASVALLRGSGARDAHAAQQLMGQNQQVLNQPRSVEDYENLLVSKQEEYERLARMPGETRFILRFGAESMASGVA